MFTVSRLLRVSILSFAGALSLVSCGDDAVDNSPVGLCDRIVKAECSRFYSCMTEAARGQYMVFGPPAQCIIEMANKVQCQNATEDKICPGPSPYPRTTAEACLNEINNASCTQIQANGTRVAAYAPSCGQCAMTTPETATQLCTRVVTAECNKLYMCTTESIRASLGLMGPVETCITNLSNQVQCAAATDQKVCAGANPYSRQQAEMCIMEANAATCTQVIANATNIAAYAPSCSQCVPIFM